MPDKMKSLFIIAVSVNILTILNAGPENEVLFTTPNEIALYKVSGGSNITTVASGLSDIGSVDFDFETQMLFYVRNKRELYFMNLITKEVKKILVLERAATIEQISVDWITKKIYFTDSVRNRIEVCKFDGSDHLVLASKKSGLSSPRGIALSPLDGLLFFTDWGYASQLASLNMDGTDLKVLVSEEVYLPSAITINHIDKKVIWYEAVTETIEIIHMDGTNRQIFHKQADIFDMTVLLGRLFVTEFKTNGIRSCTSSNKTHCNLEYLIPDGHSHIRSYGRDFQPFENLPVRDCPQNSYQFSYRRSEYFFFHENVHSACHNKNGGCSHLCLLKPNGFSCACPTGIKMLEDNRTCNSGLEKFVVFSTKSELRLISLDTDQEIDQVLPYDERHTYNALDFDPVEKKLYWTNDHIDNFAHDTGYIYRALINGSDVKTVIPKGFTLPDNVAVDWIARNLYWTCPEFNKVYISKLDGSGSTVIIDTDLKEPRGIVVDPAYGSLYWSDWGKAKIETADLDGQNRIVLVDENLKWPNGITLDYKRRHLYWVDASRGSVEFYDLNRGTRHEIESQLRTPHPYSISLIGDYVFWTDWQTRSLFQLNVETREKKILAVANNVLGVKAVDVNFHYGNNSCQIHNGGCSHFCFYKPNRPVKCGCPDGYQLDVKRMSCVSNPGHLIYSTLTRINLLSLEPGKESTVPIIFDDEIAHLGTDSKGARVFWVNNIKYAHKTSAIKSALLNDTKTASIVQTGFFTVVGGIVVDWICGNIYWTQLHLNRIEVSRLDGRYRRMIYFTKGVRLSLITVNPLKRKLYWFESRDTYSSLCSSNLDGSSRQILTNITGRPNGLTVDTNDSRIYWVTSRFSKLIESINWDGTNRTVINSSPGSPKGLTVFHDRLYYCEQEKPHAAKPFVSSIVKSSGEGETTVIEEDSQEWFQSIVTLYDTIQSGENLCERHNGGCQHLCFAISLDERICECEMHYHLAADNRSCIAPEKFILLNEESIIYRVPLQDDLGELPIHIPQIVEKIKKISYNIHNGAVYWINPKTNQINYVLNSSINIVNLGFDNIKPVSLAIDFITNNLFWVDAGKQSINFVNLNDYSKFGVIFHKKDYYPSSLEILPEKGLLFFVNDHPQRKSNTIQSITFDGILHQVIHKTNVYSQKVKQDITDLAIDYETEQIYWLNVTDTKIWSSDLTGGNLKTVMEFNKAIYHPISITVHDATLYWIDMENNNDNNTRKERLKKKSLLTNPEESIRNKISYFGRVYEHVNNVVFVDVSRKNQIHPCLNNGGCSHICFTVWLRDDVREPRCACPLGYVFQNGSSTHCEKRIVSTCLNVCDGHCHSSNILCDTLLQCKSSIMDGECACRNDEFKCTFSSVKCISLNDLCNGTKDCPHGENESKEECNRYRTNTTIVPLTSQLPQEAGTDYSSYTAGIISGAVVTSLVFICVLYIVCIHHHRKARLVKKHKKDPVIEKTKETAGRGAAVTVQLIQRTHSTSRKPSTVLTESDTLTTMNIDYRYITGSSTNMTNTVMLPLNPPPSVISPASVMSSNLTLDMDSVSRTGRDDYNSNYYEDSDCPAPPATPLYQPSDVESVATYRTSDAMFLQRQRSQHKISDCMYCNNCNKNGRSFRPSRPPSCCQQGAAAPSLASSYISSRDSIKCPTLRRQLSYAKSNVDSIVNTDRRILPSLASENSISISSLDTVRELSEYNGCSVYNTYVPPPPSPGNELYTGNELFSSPDMNDFTEYQDEQDQPLELDFLLDSSQNALSPCGADVDCEYF